MLYSEAIRLGGMMAPKCKWKFGDKKTGAVCVQGAALVSMGRLIVDDSVDNFRILAQLWPKHYSIIVNGADMPQEAREIDVEYKKTIGEISQRLNDWTEWTREQIADWVAKMEIKYGIVDETPLIQEPVEKEINDEAFIHG